MNGAEDQVLQSDDVIRPLSQNEAQLLSFIIKTYLAKLSLDEERIRNPLETQRSDTLAAMTALTPSANGTNNGQTALPATALTAAQLAISSAAASAVSPGGPFGLPPGHWKPSRMDRKISARCPPICSVATLSR